MADGGERERISCGDEFVGRPAIASDPEVPCASCGAPNLAGRRFCAGAAPRSRSLPRVRLPNQAGDRFCGGCGAALAAAARPASPSSRRGRAPAGHRPLRRPLRLHPAVAGARSGGRAPVLERYFGVVDAIVERFGGRVDKHIGDTVMACSARRSRTATSLCARAAAAAIQRSMPEIGAPLGGAGGAHRHRRRRGGRERRGQRASTARNGDRTRSTSPRAWSRGRTRQIVVDGAVQARSRAKPMRARELDGPRSTRPAWRLDALRPATRHRAPSWAPASSRNSPRCRAHAPAAGAPSSLRGEPGIGKSRLVAELGGARAEGFACHAGLVLDFGTAKGRDPFAKSSPARRSRRRRAPASASRSRARLRGGHVAASSPSSGPARPAAPAEPRALRSDGRRRAPARARRGPGRLARRRASGPALYGRGPALGRPPTLGHAARLARATPPARCSC